MRNAVPRRFEKPLEIERNTKAKAKVLRFDRRQGVILLDRSRVPAKSIMCFGLVRDLLVFLRVLPPRVHAPDRTMRKKSPQGTWQ